MRAEISLLAAQTKQEIHEMTTQAAIDLGCYEEYLSYRSANMRFSFEMQRVIVEAFDSYYRVYIHDPNKTYKN